MESILVGFNVRLPERGDGFFEVALVVEALDAVGGGADGNAAPSGTDAVRTSPRVHIRSQ